MAERAMSPEGSIAEETEPAVTELSKRVDAAEEALLSSLEGWTDPPTPRDLQEGAQNGWSPAVMSIAFWRLVNRGKLDLDQQGRVHAPPPTASSSRP